MKENLVQILIYIAKIFMRVIYYIMKMFPVNNEKVVFCSRQESDIPLDFKLIQEALKNKQPSVLCVNICKRINNKATDYIVFGIQLLRSMYHMATGKVCIIDTYWPAVSMLRHKDDLTVIQIWHSIGKMKKSGHQTVGKTSGRKREYAYLLKMHENYDYVVAGSEYWNQYYCESFNISEDKLLNFGLPRIDYLINTEKENKERFFYEYPELRNKKIILYVPTFRKNIKSQWNRIVEDVQWDENYALIVKKHPGGDKHSKPQKENVYYIDDWKSMDLISVCDFIITDYSAISLEAAVLDKKLYFWIYDYEEYMLKNGLNIDIRDEMKPYVFIDIKELVDDIKMDKYDDNFIKMFKDKYLLSELGTSTEKISDFVLDIMDKEGQRDSYEKNSDNGGWKGNKMEQSP